MTDKKRNRLLVAVAGCVAAVALVFFTLNFNKISQALTPQQEPFTELYFEDHLHLPKTLTSGNTFHIAFTIHNLEGQATIYPVNVFAQDESTPPKITPLETRSITLVNDESKTIQMELRMPEFSTPREKIVVKLDNLDQNINFWATVASPSATPNPTPRTTR